MLSTVELLDLARHHQGDVSDYRISQLLGLTPKHVSNYRVGRSRPENPIAMRLAELAGVDPVEAVAAVNIERATSPEQRAVWEAILQRVSQSKKGRKTS